MSDVPPAVHWRQQHFRPHRPLPQDVATAHGKHKHPKQLRVPFGRALLDLFIGALCLGIPFLFVDRGHHSRRADPESGLRLHSPGPVLMLCAVSCLVVSASLII